MSFLADKTNDKYANLTFMRPKIALLIISVILLTASSAHAARYISGKDAVDGGEIRWGSATMYTWERNDAINTWNAEDPINIAADTALTIEDLRFSDVNCGCYPWYGAYQERLGADSIYFNRAFMSAVSYAKRRHVATHELGHALGLDESISGNVMYESDWLYTLGSQDRDDYHYLWGY